jgi:hypothetical protein
MNKTLERIKKDRRVEHLDMDDPCGPIVTLKRGWSFDQLTDNRVLGEDSASALLKSLKRAQPFCGPFDD